MTKLYELTNSVIGLRMMVDDEAIDEQSFLDTLEAIEGEIEVKAENLLKFERELLADVDALDTEIKRLTMRKNTIKNRTDALREYLRTNMERMEIEKIACPFFVITLRKASPVLVVEDEGAIPAKYFVTIPATQRLDKKATLDALKAGEQIPGALIGESKRSLLIK